MDAILLPAILAIIKILRHSQLDVLEAKGNHLADISTRNAALKVINKSQTSVMVHRDSSPNYNLEKLAREAQYLASEKGNKIGNSTVVGLIKRESAESDEIAARFYRRLKFPLLTTVHALNYWPTDKMITFMNQYWWGNINEAAKGADLTCPASSK